jgi:hypothetical protein
MMMIVDGSVAADVSLRLLGQCLEDFDETDNTTFQVVP